MNVLETPPDAKKFTPRHFHRSWLVAAKLHQVHHRAEGATKAGSSEKVASVMECFRRATRVIV
jgi:hypothetical protein